MVKIRLQRLGAKKRPQYCIVATNEMNKRDGKHFEKLGFYYPKAEKDADKLKLDFTAYAAWVQKGAQVSTTVAQIVKANTPKA
jgi:small subunit ribosomal protein S16